MLDVKRALTTDIELAVLSGEMLDVTLDKRLVLSWVVLSVAMWAVGMAWSLVRSLAALTALLLAVTMDGMTVVESVAWMVMDLAGVKAWS